MRIINQFEVPIPDSPKEMPAEEVLKRKQYLENQYSADVGRIAQELFGYKQTQFYPARYALDVQCFPEDVWQEFKVNLRRHISDAFGLRGPYDHEVFNKLFIDLETFGQQNSKKVNEKRGQIF